MIKERFLMPALLAFTVLTGSLTAAIKYEVQSIGTLQTYCSKPIAINDAGEILGWFDLDGSGVQQYGFLRHDTGRFSGIPLSVDGMNVEWKFLTNDGSAYGTHVSGNTATLFVWSQKRGATNLGKLPGNEVTAVNDSGQVLIKSVSETLDGTKVCYPVIWEKGKITKLNGLPGNMGICSDKAYGLDLNNHGDVVGYSEVNIIYKNQIYKQIHAAKWVNGEPIDIHNKVPKQDETRATLINDDGDMCFSTHMVRADGTVIKHGRMTRCANNTYFIDNCQVYYTENPCGKSDNVLSLSTISRSLANDYDSIWLRADKFVDVNSSGEVIAMGTTIYGESHAMILRPVD